MRIPEAEPRFFAGATLLIATIAIGTLSNCAPRQDVAQPLPDSLSTRPVTPEEASRLALDSTKVTLGLNFSYQMLEGESDVALVERTIMAMEFPYSTLLELDSLGFLSDEQSVYLITRRALVRGRDSTAIAEALATEPITWHQSLPPEVSNFCVLPSEEGE